MGREQLGDYANVLALKSVKHARDISPQLRANQDFNLISLIDG
jgi:hypothetical protein